MLTTALFVGVFAAVAFLGVGGYMASQAQKGAGSKAENAANLEEPNLEAPNLNDHAVVEHEFSGTLSPSAHAEVERNLNRLFTQIDDCNLDVSAVAGIPEMRQ
jgi:hypothetical protein